MLCRIRRLPVLSHGTRIGGVSPRITPQCAASFASGLARGQFDQRSQRTQKLPGIRPEDLRSRDATHYPPRDGAAVIFLAHAFLACVLVFGTWLVDLVAMIALFGAAGAARVLRSDDDE
jgi:hypothetical protein